MKDPGPQTIPVLWRKRLDCMRTMTPTAVPPIFGLVRGRAHCVDRPCVVAILRRICVPLWMNWRSNPKFHRSNLDHLLSKMPTWHHLIDVPLFSRPPSRQPLAGCTASFTRETRPAGLDQVWSLTPRDNSIFPKVLITRLFPAEASR